MADEKNLIEDEATKMASPEEFKEVFNEAPPPQPEKEFDTNTLANIEDLFEFFGRGHLGCFIIYQIFFISHYFKILLASLGSSVKIPSTPISLHLFISSSVLATHVFTLNPLLCHFLTNAAFVHFSQGCTPRIENNLSKISIGTSLNPL